MNIDQQNVREFHTAMLKAGCTNGADPTKPTMPSLEKRILRAKLMLEECLETIHDGLGVSFNLPVREYHPTSLDLEMSCLEFRERHPGDLVKLADGIADLKYVAHGTALTAGIDMEPVDAEVHRSNMTKFDGGHFREDGKYIKPPTHSPPDIQSILVQQGVESFVQ